MAMRMKESFTVRMDDLVVRPVAVARRPARMDYVMDLGGLAGASGSMPAWVDGAGAMMSSAFAGKGQPASGSANVTGTQHEQPEVQHPPLQAAPCRVRHPDPPKRAPPSRGPPRSSAGFSDRSRAGASGSRSSLLHARLSRDARLRYVRLTHVGPIHVSPIHVSPILVSPIHARGRHGRKQSSAQAGQRSSRPLPRSALPTPDARSCRRLNLSTMAED